MDLGEEAPSYPTDRVSKDDDDGDQQQLKPPCPPRPASNNKMCGRMSSHDSSSSSTSSSSVSFGSVEVREFERVIGDDYETPTALALGWNYNENQSVDVDEYEERRSPQYTAQPAQYSATSARKTKSLKMEPTKNSKRFSIFQEWGYSISDILAAERQRGILKKEMHAAAAAAMEVEE